MILESHMLLAKTSKEANLKYLIYFPDDYFIEKKKYPLVLKELAELNY